MQVFSCGQMLSVNNWHDSVPIKRRKKNKTVYFNPTKSPIFGLKQTMVKIFLGGFPPDSTELELVQLVSPYAEVSTIKIVRDKVTKKCKGYAFLELKDEAGADRAMDALDGLSLKGKPLSVNKVIDAPVKRPRRPRL